MRAICGVPLVALALSACGINQQPTPSLVTQCEVPRPPGCTMEYAPVCADLLVGLSKGYSSGCNACADDAVAGYLPGPCPSNEK